MFQQVRVRYIGPAHCAASFTPSATRTSLERVLRYIAYYIIIMIWTVQYVMITLIFNTLLNH